MFSSVKDKDIRAFMPFSRLVLEFSEKSREGGFMYILSCSGKLEEYTGKKFAALGSIFGFRKFGRC